MAQEFAYPQQQIMKIIQVIFKDYHKPHPSHQLGGHQDPQRLLRVATPILVIKHLEVKDEHLVQVNVGKQEAKQFQRIQ